MIKLYIYGGGGEYNGSAIKQMKPFNQKYTFDYYQFYGLNRAVILTAEISMNGIMVLSKNYVL